MLATTKQKKENPRDELPKIPSDISPQDTPDNSANPNKPQEPTQPSKKNLYKEFARNTRAREQKPEAQAGSEPQGKATPKADLLSARPGEVPRPSAVPRLEPHKHVESLSKAWCNC
eukprot:TRINITY_DN24662_c0_g1_i1.p1 TRINITY_DN24662_c0_g1~~TRINITY_DN24662_c0_g1_i1.p1  ORF type:complete len:116 (-),score=12.12 TRINITY_DN24662_c0_g1_i1:117-464(-)